MQRWNYETTLTLLLYADQQKHYSIIFHQLQDNSSQSKTVLLGRAHIVKTSNGLLCRWSFLPTNTLSKTEKFSILLNPTSYLTRLIVLDIHSSIAHQQAQITLPAIRHKYYLPKSYSTMQHILHKFCFHCRKYRAKPLKQPIIATLPDYRLVEGYQPFSHIGIDIFGPFLVFDKWPKKDTSFSYNLHSSNSSHSTQSSQKILSEIIERKKIFALIFTCFAI